MSRIGKKPIAIPKGVTVKIDGGAVVVKGPKGQMKQALPPGVTAVVEDTQNSDNKSNLTGSVTINIDLNVTP